MALLEEIQKKVEPGEFEFSKHAVDQSILRNITVQELRESLLLNARIIEKYPDGKHGPSCLIFGFTENKRPSHIQCSYPSRSILKIINLYEPDPSKWIDFQTRKEQ